MSSTQTLLGKTCLFTGIGFVAVMLSGPIIAVVSLVLSLLLVIVLVVPPLALIGLAIWVVANCLVQVGGRWQDRVAVRDRAADWCARGRRIAECSLTRARAFSNTLLETLSGALVGGFLGAVLLLESVAGDGRIVVGVAVGALVGLMVGTWNCLARTGEGE